MIFPALFLLLLGFVHSSFFGGAEAGFYRVPRIRIQIDAIAGNKIARAILWLINHPSFFIATVLVGNNLANYLVSMGGVLLIQALFNMTGDLGSILATILLTPFLFVLGEMFPKYLALNAPHRFLRRIAPFFSFYVFLFLPITIVFWLIDQGIALVLGKKHEAIRTILARKELARGLDEGEYAGVLFSVQRTLTQNVFRVASQSMQQFTTPLSVFPEWTREMPPETLLSEAKKHRKSEFPLFSEQTPKQPIGYLRTFELELTLKQSESGKFSFPLRELIEINEAHSPLNALLLFQATGESLAYVENDRGEITGLVSEDDLRRLMFSKTDSAK